MSIEISAQLDRPQLPANAATDIKCLFTIRPSRDLTSAVQVTTGVCLAFDCSASMQGDKLETAIAAAQALVRSIHSRHSVSLLGFQTRTHLLIDNVRVTSEEREAIVRRVEGIRRIAGGSTDTAAGIEEGAKVLLRAPVDARVMLLLSDGLANDAVRAERAAIAATRQGVQLIAVGIGAEYEADHLLQLVTPSNGVVLGKSDLEQIEPLFAGLLRRIESFVGTNARLEVELGDGVRAGAAYKTSPEQAFLGTPPSGGERRLVLNVGNVERGEIYGFVLGLSAPARHEGRFTIARATLRYDVPALNRRADEQRLPIEVSYGAAGERTRASAAGEAFNNARGAELVLALAEAHRRSDVEKVRAALAAMRAHATLSADTALATRIFALEGELRSGRRLSRNSLNELIVGSTHRARPGPARVAVVPMMTGARPPAPPGETWDVVLLDPGPTTVRLVRELRDATGLTLSEIKDIVEAPPASLRRRLSRDEADRLVVRLLALGARAETKRHEPVTAELGA